MKQILNYFKILLIATLFISCEAEEIKTETPDIYTSHNPIPSLLIGTYESHQKEVITITQDWIEIGAETYFLSQYRTFDNKGCWYIIFLDNDTQIRIKYFRLKYGYIELGEVNYYKQEKR